MSVASGNRVWLSREGKTEGPFSPEQVRAMKDSGEFSMYAWCWEESAKTWKPIHPVPAPPVADAQSNSSAIPTAPMTQTAATKSERVKLAKALSVVCHDNKHVTGGTLDASLGGDGLFRSEDFSDGFPPFRKGQQLSIHLLDETSGKSESAQAEIVELKKSAEYWEYRLKWRAVPKIFGEAPLGS